MFSRNFYFLPLLPSGLSLLKKAFLSCSLKKIKCSLSLYCCFSFAGKRGIRFATNVVPLRRIKCQWFCSALLNLGLLNYSTLWWNEGNHLNYLCFNRSSPHLSTNGVSSFSGKTRASASRGAAGALAPLMQELPSRAGTDSQLWRSRQVPSFVLFLGF